MFVSEDRIRSCATFALRCETSIATCPHVLIKTC